MPCLILYGQNVLNLTHRIFYVLPANLSKTCSVMSLTLCRHEANSKGFWELTFWNHLSNFEDFTFREFFMDCLEIFYKTEIRLPFIPQVEKHCPWGCNFYSNTVTILKLTLFRKLLPPPTPISYHYILYNASSFEIWACLAQLGG